METLTKNYLWEEKNSTEAKTKLESKLTLGQNNGINETKNVFVENECEDTGNKWKKKCPNCERDVFYTTEEGLKKSINYSRNCLTCGSFKKDRYVGMKFGTLLILKQYNVISPCNSKIVKVDYKCDCEYVGLNKRIGCVKRQKMCLLCKKKNDFKFKEKGRSAFNCLYNDYKKSAENRNYVFELTKEKFEFLTHKNCFYCGEIPQNVKLALKGKERYVYSGIDRKDNNIGYTIENCVPCCKNCNFSKMKLSVGDFLNHVKKIYENVFVTTTG